MFQKLSKLTGKINFQRQLNLLLAITFATIISIMLFFVFYILSFKNVMDRVYEYSFAPLARLEDIANIHLLNVSQANTLKSKEISKPINKMSDEWQKYLDLLEKQKERPAIAKTLFFALPQDEKNFFKLDLEEKISINISYLQMLFSIRENSFEKEIINKIDNTTNIIKQDLYLLIAHYLKEITNQKIQTDYIYKSSIYKLFYLVFTTILLFAFISITLIIKSKRINTHLNELVEQKTKELQTLNSNLETRLKQELEISRQKDKTILLQSRMASLGEMLQNVSHQWRQPLGAITMIIQSFETKLQKKKLTPEFIKSQVEQALILSNGMSKTLDDFKNFFSPSRKKSKFLLDEMIEDAIKLSSYILQKYQITLNYQTTEKNLTLYSYKNELMQVVINIINNAKDALKEKLYDKIININTYTQDNFAIIDISDNGGGINEEIIEKIFEPYFTTKHQSVGTGIGLYMSKNIIEKHIQGEINVKNVILSLENMDLRCANFILKIPLTEET